MLTPIDLIDKKILITGASAGIGKKTAVILSNLGAKCVLVARSEDKLTETLSLLKGGGHSYYVLDLSNIASIEPCINNIVHKEGPFDGFTHCAGVGENRPLQQMKYKNAHRIMLISYYAYLETIRCLTKKGRFNPGLSIVGISSIATNTCRPSQTAYVAAKSAMDAAMRCLALELAPKNIRINNVAPGMIATEMYEAFKRKFGDDESLQGGRMGVGEPSDVAYMIAYLLSDAAKFISRSRIEITKGDHLP